MARAKDADKTMADKMADKTIDVCGGRIYHRRPSGILAEGLSLTIGPRVELHYGPESGTPSTPPN
jgi:hypothetical protein